MYKTTNQGYNLIENTDTIASSIQGWNGNANMLDKTITALEDNFDVATSSNGNNYIITDSASGYNKGNIKIGDGPELEQDSPMIYKCDGTESGDYYFVYNNTNYQFTMPTITSSSVLEFNTDTLTLILDGTAITTTEASAGTLITLTTSPNPDYPQDIKVVEGEAEIIDSNVGNMIDNNEFAQQNSEYYNYSSTNGLTVKKSDERSGANIYGIENIKPSTSYKIVTTDMSNISRIQAFEYKDSTFKASNTFTDLENAIFTTTSTTNNIKIKVFSDNYPAYIGFLILTENTDKEIKYKQYPITLPTGMFLGKIGTASNYIYGTRDNWKLHQELINLEIVGTENWVALDRIDNTTKFFTLTLNERTSIASTQQTTGELSNLFIQKNPYLEVGDYFWAYDNGTITVLRIGLASSDITTSEGIKAWLSNKKPKFIYPLKTSSEISITDATLASQLNNIADNLQTYKGETIVFTTSENLEPNIQFDYLVNPLASIEARLALLED